MNKWIGVGRLTRDPDIRYSGELAIARFTLAVERRFAKENEAKADFISCVAFGKTAQFIEKYVAKGTKIVVDGRIQTGSYEKDGQKVYTTEIVVESTEFAESKKSSGENPVENKKDDGFVDLPEGFDDELPFS
mgnify:CR=1 FL=1